MKGIKIQIKGLFNRFSKVLSVHLRSHPYLLFMLTILFLFYLYCLPKTLFSDPYSLLLEDRAGNLLGARVAADGQWRFPPDEVPLPSNYVEALLTFEDKRFFWHPGVDLWSLGGALVANLRAGRIVRGASTLSMQVIRLSRKGKPRTIGEKLIEIILATRLEWRYSKAAILKLYAAHAPFGGNVVGLEAACWRYFGKGPGSLSWAEATLLAVLPNSPALLHPGRSRDKLLNKRNRLLDKLVETGVLDSLTCALAQEEKIPAAPLPLPRLAPHLLDRYHVDWAAGTSDRRVRLTLDPALQQAATDRVRHHHQVLRKNFIHNAAAIILEVESNEILAWVGNAPGAGSRHSEQVNLPMAPRSTGSIMKPFLYCLALQEGLLLPHTLLPDLPVILGDFKPENYQQEYDGVVPASQALVRSLNIPFVHLLKDFGVPKFRYALERAGIRSLRFPASHYGLSLILGGAEASLLELSGVYASMARTLNHYVNSNSRYFSHDYRPPSLEPESVVRQRGVAEPTVFGAGAIWQTFEVMRKLERPGATGGWEQFESGFPVAWKTGTSYGFRDAWAIGVTPRHVVAVWVGNADGEGRPGLIGFQAAAPLLFELFSLLPEHSGWFEKPFDDLQSVIVCPNSGERASPNCPKDTILIPAGPGRRPSCSNHRLVWLDSTGNWQVQRDCAFGEPMERHSFFVLSPAQEYYYRRKHPTYRSLPPWRPDCNTPGLLSDEMQLLYPHADSRIRIPIELDGSQGKVTFRAAHRRREAHVFWYLDANFIKETTEFHEVEVNPSGGLHQLTLIDDTGERLEHSFEIVEKKTKGAVKNRLLDK